MNHCCRFIPPPPHAASSTRAYSSWFIGLTEPGTEHRKMKCRKRSYTTDRPLLTYGSRPFARNSFHRACPSYPVWGSNIPFPPSISLSVPVAFPAFLVGELIKFFHVAAVHWIFAYYWTYYKFVTQPPTTSDTVGSTRLLLLIQIHTITNWVCGSAFIPFGGQTHFSMLSFPVI